MGFSYPEIRKLKGVFLNRNSFDIPEGSLEEGKNIVVQKHNVYTSRRGSYTYFDPVTGTLKRNFLYQNYLLSIYDNKLGYYTDTGSSPNETGSENLLSGETIEVSSDVPRDTESNGNLYFTSDQGPKKLTAYNSDIFNPGAPQGLDLRARYLNGTSSTVFTAGKIVGWRYIFGYKDANQNLILSAPSGITTLTNTEVTGVSWVRATNVVTVTSTSHGLETGMYIIVSNSSGGTPEVADGVYQITVTGANTFTFAETASDDASGNTLDYAYAMPVQLEGSVASEITTDLTWFVQIYRSSQQDSSVGIFSDFKLVLQRDLTSAEISAGVFFFTDDFDDVLLGEYLYTNENSREGEAASNFRPPLCKDIITYKDFVLYLNCTTRHLLNLNVVDPTDLSDNDFVEVKSGSTYRKYIGYYDSSNDPVANQTVYGTCSSSSGLLITYENHGFPSSGANTIYVSEQTGGSLAVGTYYVIYVDADTFRISTTLGGSAVSYNSETSVVFQGVKGTGTAVTGQSWVRSSNVVTVTSTAHGLQVGMQVYAYSSSGGSPDVTTGIYTLTAVTDDTFSFAETAADDASGNTLSYAPYENVFLISNNSSAAIRIRETAVFLVKAINRDSSSLIYAQYASLINEIPGKMRFMAKGFIDPIYLRASSSTAGNGFSPVLPSSYSSGTQVFSDNESLPHVGFSSKYQEPEAVPLGNRFNFGIKNREILRGAPLRDSVIICKDDGLYRMTGDDPSNFQIVPLDTTIKIVAKSSLDVLNNTVIFLSNQGICRVTESSVEIISDDIRDAIAPIIGQDDIDAQTSGVAYETEGLYILSTTEPDSTTASIVWVFSIITNQWTHWDSMFTQARIGPNDTLYFINSDNELHKERKKQTRIDYSGQNHTITIDSIAADGLSGTITISTGIPQKGDMIVKNNVICRLADDPEAINAVQYSVAFDRTNTLAASDSVTLYSTFTRKVKLAPFHAGLIGRMKLFALMQVHLRDENLSAADISFSGPVYGGSEVNEWEAQQLTEGWGNFPWGFEPFGQQESINLPVGTKPAPIIRVPVSVYHARGTFIQPVIEHFGAGEMMNIQAFSFAVRAYGERTTR